jgi:hypothetical protein
MIIGPFELLIISPVDRESLVAEINLAGQGVAEISQDASGEFKLEIFVKPGRENWLFDCRDFQKTLEAGITRLRDGG